MSYTPSVPLDAATMCASKLFVQPLPYIPGAPPSVPLISCPLCELYVRRNASATPLCATFRSSDCTTMFPVPTLTIRWSPPGTVCS